MVMYSNGGAYPVPALPFRVRRINGLTYTAEAVYENLSDETNPWFEVNDPPAYDPSTHTSVSYTHLTLPTILRV